MINQLRIDDNGRIEDINKIDKAIEILKLYEPEEGYHLAFSGGKDSIVIYDLAIKAGVKFHAQYNITTVDPPELVKFIREEYKEVLRKRPDLTMWQLIKKNKFPPLRWQRWCCKELKEGAGKDKIVITGIRWEESNRRSKRRLLENCLKGNARLYLNIIIEWSSEEVWQYIKENKLKYCTLYDEGFKRIGCVMCPMAHRSMKAQAARWPKIAAAYKRTINEVYNIRKNEGLKMDFQSGDDFYNWWITGERRKDYEESKTIFE